MADEKTGESQDQTEIEKTSVELNEAALDQISGGMQGGSNYASDIFAKQPGNLTGNAKKPQFNNIPADKTVKL